MTDYNDGKWHGWNGGECPVHPQSIVEVASADGIHDASAAAWDWSEADDIVAFRVVTPYVEPQTYTGNCWAYHYTSLCPTTADSKVGHNSAPGKWTAEHVNGKLRRFSWEADE